MPAIEVRFFRNEDGSTPLVEWFDTLRPSAVTRCLARLTRLEQLGHELRRPEADILREGIYELRVKDERLQYRMLYFFHGRKAVIVSHGFVKKESKVPERDIKTALTRKRLFEQNPAKHTFSPGA